MQSEFVGKTFHFLTITAAVVVGTRSVRLQCVCVCGNQTMAKPFELRNREKTSCGCWKRAVLGERSRTHGRANSRISGYSDRTYGVWQAMRDRCTNPHRADYHRYGGRGITVCKRWDKFENFLADMGEAPPNLTLDRKDNDKGYSPKNCRWATRNQQSYNSTTVVWVEWGGMKKSISDWCRYRSLSKSTYYSRRKRGWSVLQALGLSPTDK